MVPNIVGQDYQQALRVGSGDNLQNFNQKRFYVRDDFTWLDLHGWGDHVVKVGAVFAANDYDVQKTAFGIPVYRFRSDIPAGDPFAFPFEAQLGFGDPDLSLKNNQFGVYAQDDWTINSCLTANIGLRWDYESDMLNNDYVTPRPRRPAALPLLRARVLHRRQRAAEHSPAPSSRAWVWPGTSRARVRRSSSAAGGATTTASSTTPSSTSSSGCSTRC